MEFLKYQDANFSSRPTQRVSRMTLPKDIIANNVTRVTRHLRKVFVTELTGSDMLRSIAKMSHSEFIPFGSGRRQCPGLGLGALAVHLELANLLHAFEWSLPEGMAPEELDMTEELVIVLRMQKSLAVVAKPRLPTHLYQC